VFQNADPKASMQKRDLKANIKDHEEYQDTLLSSAKIVFT